jgi:hypothetical protein
VTGLRAGGEIDAFCTKCKMVLAHTILAVSGGRPARVQCNTCNGQHNYRSASGDAKPAASARESSPRSSTRETPTKTRITVDELIAQKGGVSRPYSPKTTFAMDDVVSHPTFGTGLVEAVRSDKIDVIFRIGTKTLVHGRG